MESERFMRFWFRITEFYGLWPRKTNKCHNAIVYIWVYSYVTIYAILKLSLIPSSTKVQDFVEIFVYLPAFLLLTIKFSRFLSASDKLGKLLKTMKDLSNELGIKSGMEFKSFPLLFKVNVAQAIIFTIGVAIDTTKLAINRKMLVKLWMPEDWENKEMFYWIYFCYERSSVSIVMILLTFDIITFAIIINLTRLAKALSTKLREINLLRTENWPRNMKDVVRINEKLRNACALFEEIFSVMLLFQQVLGVVLICMVLFSMLYFEKFDQFLISYGTSIVLQIFLYCFFITQLETTCESFVQDLYQCDWTDEKVKGDRKRKQDLLTLMTFQQKPIKISIIGLFSMNLPVFLSVSFAFE